MRRFFLTGFYLLAFCALVFSQNETDALRYSRIGFGGTSRYNSMAGAFGAVGGDLSVLSTNPGGLGLYRKNEMAFSPAFFSQNISSDYNGTISRGYRFNFRFDNFGFVFAGKTGNTNENGWQSIAMGITYNRYSSFQADYDMKGNSSTSMMDSWARSARGTGPSGLDVFNEGLAWNAYLLNTAPSDTTYYTDTIPNGDQLVQEKTISTRGGMGEWVFAIAGNYSNRLFVGGSIGIPQVKYDETIKYTEKEVNDSVSEFDYLEFNQYLVTTGRGFNCKLGLIYRPIDLIRVGFSWHSPSILKLSDAYSADMSSVIGGANFKAASPDGTFNYSIRTPMHMTGSLAVIIGKVGLVDCDVEMVDYSEAKIKAANYSFNEANAAIKSKYKNTENIRLGGEMRLLPFTFRAGFAWYGSPYADVVNNTAARLYFTGGVGYRDPNDKFFIDFGIVTTTEKSNYYFYDQSLVNPVKNTSRFVNAIVSVGFRY